MKLSRYGWVRDLPDKRDVLYLAPAEISAALPPRVDLRDEFPAPYDQGALGSCTANAIAGALQFLELKEHEQPAVMPSRLFIYYNERVLEGSVSSDSGAQIRDGIKVVVKEGYCAESEWPYVEDRFADQPPQRCYNDALKERVSQYLRLPRDLVPLLTCLASGYPFVFGFSVYASFESPQVKATGVVNLPQPGEEFVGGHAVVACGYDQAQRRFIVRNSWGSGWGMQGYFTLPYTYLIDAHLASDFWQITLVG
ncbi:MAG TPA: C1 family peptidase [Streptosporangiaceae bacterium]|nr:C1 family peptidase [Streptosporangiaceae bacterium]